MNSKLISMVVLMAISGSAWACPPESEGSDVKIMRQGVPLGVTVRRAPTAVSMMRVAPVQVLAGGEAVPEVIEVFDPRTAPEAVAIGGPETSVFVSKNGDREVRVTLRDGKVESATENGKAIDPSRVRMEGERIIVKGDGGETIAEFSAPANERRKFDVLTTAPKLGGLFGVAGEPGDATPPKSMIGITLAPGDDILCGHLGVSADDVTLVSGVSEGLAADAAGLKPYDVIVEINGKKPASPEAVRKAVRDLEPGAKVTLRVIHKGVERELTVTTETFDAKKLETAKANMIPDARRDLAATVPGEGMMVVPKRGGITLFGGHEGALDEQEMAKLQDEMARLNRDVQGKWKMEYERRLEDAAKNRLKADEMRKMAEDLAKSAPNTRQRIWVQPPARADDEERMRRLEEMMERLEKKMDEMNKRQEQQPKR